MKANHKRLKAVLASEVRNFDPSSIASKFVKFSLFDNFFPDLAKFQDLDNFSLFNFLNLDNFPYFLMCFISFPPILNPFSSLLPLFLLKASLLLLFLLEADLLSSFLLKADLSGYPVVFSIEVSKATILLKPQINRL